MILVFPENHVFFTYLLHCLSEQMTNYSINVRNHTFKIQRSIGTMNSLSAERVQMDVAYDFCINNNGFNSCNNN